MLFYRLLFLFRSYTFIIVQEMIFFKKKSKKITEKFKEIKPTSPSQSVEPVKLPVLPSITTNEQQIKRENEKWLELNIPGDFSSSFNIHQFSSNQEGACINSITNTTDTCSTSTIDIHTDFDAIIKNTEASVSSHSKKDIELPPDAYAAEEQDSLEIIKVDKLSISSYDKNQNGGDSLTYSEGEMKSVPDKQENTLPVFTEVIQETIIHKEELYFIQKDDMIVVNSDIFIDEEDTVFVEENTPCLGNDQLLLEQTHLTTLDEQEIIESPTLPPPKNTVENSVVEIKEEEEEEKEIDLPTKIQQSDKQLEARSETVASLEIASHQQEIDITLKQDLFLPEVSEKAIKEAVEEEKVTEVCLAQCDDVDEKMVALEGAAIKKSDIVVKRKSGHSLIPRKQQYTASVIENAPVAIVSKELASNMTSDTNTKRRGSSGSFIPTFQQNRLSLIITETNDKNWSPSTSSDTLPKSPSSILSSTSTSSSGSSSVTRRKEKRSSLKSHRLSNIPNVAQQSKIPVAGLNVTPNSIPKNLPSYASSVGNMSKLPKRNTTFV
ncbi:hypothetical protein EDC94DRAFT_232422 [Helicostylum pulchrum]|nr:hypothetical protein EDC94DRAFT_232422 [Helicostylum pulchrum]